MREAYPMSTLTLDSFTFSYPSDTSHWGAWEPRPLVSTDIGDAIHVGSPTLGERSRQVREEFCQKGRTLVQQDMDVLSLRNPSACPRIFWKPIALNERDVVEVV